MSKITNSTGGAVTVGVAATKKGGGWEHFYLGSGEDTAYKTDDPDGFVCYESSTGKLVGVIYEGEKRYVWRLHDFTTVEIRKNSSDAIEAFTSFGSFRLCGYYGGCPGCNLLRAVELQYFHYDFPRSL
jgi:hypothetical protein